MAQPDASSVHTPAVSGSSAFRCSKCGKGMADWKSGSICAHCQAHDETSVAKFNPNHDERGRFTTGSDGALMERLGPIDGVRPTARRGPVDDDGRDDWTDHDGGFLDLDAGSRHSSRQRSVQQDDHIERPAAEREARRRAGIKPVTYETLPAAERADLERANVRRDHYIYARNKGYTHDDAIAASRSRGGPIGRLFAKEHDPMSTPLFKCASCSTPMEHWRDGSNCSTCVIAKALGSFAKYSPSQPRDDQGQWTDSGGSSRSIGSQRHDSGVTMDEYMAADSRTQAQYDAKGEARRSSANRYVDLMRERRLRLGQVHDKKGNYLADLDDKKVRQDYEDYMAGRHDDTVFRNLNRYDKAAAKPGAPKPQSSGAKKPAGNVQDEFPRCPTCGTPTKTGEKCDDCKKSTEREHKTGDLTVAQMEAQMREAEVESEEEGERRDIRRRARAAMARMLGLDDLAKAAVNAQGNPPLVLKASTAKRFSFAPMYMPGRLDAHGEFVKSGEDLQQAAWEYVRKTSKDRTVYLQHIDKPAGEWVEITSWPYPVEALMTVPGSNGQVRKATLPAGTVYMGVIWKDWAWDLVQKGRLLGFSMGGWAKRVQAELADESVTKSAHLPDNGEPWTEAGIVNPQHPATRSRLPYRG